jgi:recombination protein RecA
MSSPLFGADLAPGCPVVFPRREKPALVFERLSALPKLASVRPASRLEIRPTPEMVSSGIGEIDALTGGLPRGCITEVCGSASSGRTSMLLATLAAATRRQEVCALVDASDAFDPLSGDAAGVVFEKMLWVRCGGKNSPQRHPSTLLRAGSVTEKRIKERNQSQNHVSNFLFIAAERRENAAHGASRGDKIKPTQALEGRKNRYPTAPEGPLENALRTTDLLLQSGGFGMIVLDLGDIPFKSARRIPLTTWFRFQRAVETTPTILFVIAESPLAQTCASLLVKVQSGKLSAFSSQPSVENSGGHGFSRAAEVSQESQTSVPSHAQLFEGLSIEGELLRSRLERKPAQSVNTSFTTSVSRVS